MEFQNKLTQMNIVRTFLFFLLVIPLFGKAQNLQNIIIIETDQQRFDLLGYMGNKIVKTPNIDRLATKSFILTNQFTVSPICTPSRTSFFTGKYVIRTGNVINSENYHLQPNDWSFIDPLKKAGYAIGLAGKNHTFSESFFKKYFDYREETSHFGKTHGSITEDDKIIVNYLTQDNRPGYEKSKMLLEGLVEGPIPFKKEDCPAYRTADDGIKFLEDFNGRPFFLYFSFGDPHWPTIAPEPYYSMYNPDSLELPEEDFNWVGHPFKHFVQSKVNGYDHYTHFEKARILATYYAQISFVDASIGRLLDKLETMDLMKNTIIVFTSDHGDFAGNYGMVAKTGGFQESLIRIPGLVYLPNMKGNGKKIDVQISNIDVMPTIFEYIRKNYPKDVQGKSFLDVLTGKNDKHRDVIFSEVGTLDMPPPAVPVSQFKKYADERAKKDGMFWFIDYTTKGRSIMIRKNDWKYIYNTGDLSELYNFKNDPLELNNLIDNPKFSDIQKDLNSQLINWLLVAPIENIR